VTYPDGDVRNLKLSETGKVGKEREGCTVENILPTIVPVYEFPKLTPEEEAESAKNAQHFLETYYRFTT
jgi:hypothetical protein